MGRDPESQHEVTNKSTQKLMFLNFVFCRFMYILWSLTSLAQCIIRWLCHSFNSGNIPFSPLTCCYHCLSTWMLKMYRIQEKVIDTILLYLSMLVLSSFDPSVLLPRSWNCCIICYFPFLVSV